MAIINELNKRADNGNIPSKLLNLANEIAQEASGHLKLVIQQLPEFDIHDDTHSLKIIENMEGLMKQEVISKLSSYELFLLYMSGYLHDCAMALPSWELNLLVMTEGKEGFTRNTIRKSLANDGKIPYKLSKAIEVIRENAAALYGDFNNCRQFIFSFKTENELQRDLAERLIDYQQFRNGFAEELNDLKDKNLLQDYLEFSDLIRYDYIRITHAKRVEKYLANLSSLFTDRLEGVWGEALAKDLAKICRSHGESMEYVRELEEQASYYGQETANLQFVAMMLRLGDILHFSHDRAPKSLFSEKMIRSKESLMHWKAKFQGINYSLDEVDSNGRFKIKYMAYCDEPNLYYFIQEYLDWINVEISNYFKFIHDIKYSSRTFNLADKYMLPIAEEVDRSQIRFNETKFIPVEDLKFKLDQKKILELLMGVGLYKNKYLCLRELYQNSLDACRCMISIMMERQVEILGEIEFGLGSCIENNQKRTFLYCRDNGIGMTKDKIANYFLNIGNSFYKSREFQKLSSTWKENFQPTSQFGIGILSCFMIGDKLEITTKSLTNNGENGENICFSIEGPHEHFYFMKPDELDLEQIGQHGTLIKVFLNEDVFINDENFDRKFQLLSKGADKNYFYDKYPDLIKNWETHIYNHIYSSIGVPSKNVDIQIKMSNGEHEILSPWNSVYDITEYDDELIKGIFSNSFYMRDGYNPIEDYLKVKPFINSKVLTVATKDIEYTFLLSLPLPGLSLPDYRVLSFESRLYQQNAILVDGVVVNNDNSLLFEFGDKRDLLRNGAINFIGKERPILSVDRNTITSISQNLRVQFNELPMIVAQRIVEKVYEHFDHNPTLDSKEKQIIWDYIFEKFNSITETLINTIVANNSVDLQLIDLVKFTGMELSASEFVQENNIVLKGFDMRELSQTEELIAIGKLSAADNIEVMNNDVIIESASFNQIKYQDSTSRDGLIPIAINSNSWRGLYEEYDLVSSLWPIVPSKLFLSLSSHSVNEINSRIKAVGKFSNSLSGLAKIDPVLVHPKMGLFSKSRNSFWNKVNWVGKFENPANNFWLSELNDDSRKVYEDKEDFFLFAYISPRDLSEEEKLSLEDYREEEEEYYNGASNGWSVLLLGNTGKFIVNSGIVKRCEMVKKIMPSFWKTNNEISFKFTDGTSVEPLKSI